LERLEDGDTQANAGSLNAKHLAPEEAREHWFAGFAGWAGTWKVIPLILFVLTYKLGEFAIGPMVKPFWVDYGKSIWPAQDDLMFQIGLFPTTFGIVLSVAGALMGGAFISRYGIFHGIWFLGALQAVSNLGYSLVEWLDLGRFGLAKPKFLVLEVSEVVTVEARLRARAR